MFVVIVAFEMLFWRMVDFEVFRISLVRSQWILESGSLIAVGGSATRGFFLDEVVRGVGIQFVL